MRKGIGSFILLLITCYSFAQPFDRIESTAQLNNLRNNAGVAVADFDRDNDLDIFVVAKYDFSQIEPTTWSRLFSNNNDGTFEDVTLSAGFDNLYNFDEDDPGWEYGVKLGVSWGDYDNDGYPDLFLTGFHHVQLFHNEGDGTFQEVTETAGFPTEDYCYNTSSLWWDFNKDGFLDIYISRWGGCQYNRYFQNNGDGTFVERTQVLNVGSIKDKTWMAAPIDANEDGLWDIYVANDFDENELFIQNGDQTFIDKASDYFANFYGNDMGIAIGDYDNDGAFDFYVTNITENRLFSFSGGGQFGNVAPAQNVSGTYWAWGTRFGDFDLDGDEDLFVANGYQKDLFFFPDKKENFLFKNLHQEGQGVFTNWSVEAEVDEFSNSMGMDVFDYDNDGDLDVFVSNTDDKPFFYENKVTNGDSINEPNWVNIRLEGTVSNRDGLGSQLKIWNNGAAQHRFYYGAGFFSQSLQAVNFGLGAAQIIDSLEITWDSGIVEKFYDLPVNKNIFVKENEGLTILDLQHQKVFGCTDPVSCNYDPDATVDDGTCNYLPAYAITGNTTSGYLTTETYIYPENAGSTYHWEITNGEIISGQGAATVTVQWHLAMEGELSVKEINTCESEVVTLPVNLGMGSLDSKFSVARLWNEALLYAIRNDYARPTVHARNLFHASIAMYDAWAVYDEEAQTYFLGKEVDGFMTPFEGFTTETNMEEARKESISFAAYRLLTHRFINSPNYMESLKIFDALFEELGYVKENIATDYTSGDPAALGNYIAEMIIEFGFQDGAAELQQYENAYYETVNPPLITNNAGNPNMVDPNRWQPLALETFIDQAGNLIDGSTPDFLSPEWGNVSPFSLNNNDRTTYTRSGETYYVYQDPGTPPFLDTLEQNESSEQYKWGFSLVSVWGSHLSPDDGVFLDISPKSIGNISSSDFPSYFNEFPGFYNRLEGGDTGKGRALNPVTQEPYPEQLVPRGDYSRVLAEFWADGPDSETPPGHWFVLLNKVNDHPLLEKRLGGKGVLLSDLEWDVKSYFIMGGTMHDAAIAAWSIKGWYDYIRPISAIRYMADRGQSSDSGLESYDVGGIPLEEGFVEIVTPGDDLAGVDGEHIGKIKLYTWRGHRFINDPEVEYAGVDWILAENWMPYQRPSFVTPPFAGYVSGHSTYSRAAAEVMTLLTGDEYFPGGVGEFLARKNEFLVFEEGPSQDVILQWATYRDASDQCSLSRIWGGIHPPADDITGRLIGEELGKEAFAFAIPYFSTEKMLEEVLTVIFPNPASASSTVTLSRTNPEMTFEVFNIQGVEIPISSVEYDANFKCTALDIGNLNPGVYIIASEDKSWKLVVL
jgi:hypothetical protein